MEQRAAARAASASAASSSLAPVGGGAVAQPVHADEAHLVLLARAVERVEQRAEIVALRFLRRARRRRRITDLEQRERRVTGLAERSKGARQLVDDRGRRLELENVCSERIVDGHDLVAQTTKVVDRGALRRDQGVERHGDTERRRQVGTSCHGGGVAHRVLDELEQALALAAGSLCHVAVELVTKTEQRQLRTVTLEGLVDRGDNGGLRALGVELADERPRRRRAIDDVDAQRDAAAAITIRLDHGVEPPPHHCARRAGRTGELVPFLVNRQRERADRQRRHRRQHRASIACSLAGRIGRPKRHIDRVRPTAIGHELAAVTAGVVSSHRAGSGMPFAGHAAVAGRNGRWRIDYLDVRTGPEHASQPKADQNDSGEQHGAQNTAESAEARQV
jgi:hypothetical protein